MSAALLLLAMSGLIGGMGFLARRNRQRGWALIALTAALLLFATSIAVAFWASTDIESGGSGTSASPTPTARMSVGD